MQPSSNNIPKDGTKRKVILLMGMGLNGISADGWIPPADTKAQVEEIMDDLWDILDTVDTFILGRITFQMWENHWPQQAGKPSTGDFLNRFSKFADEVQKLVFSTTMKSAKWQNSRVINDGIATEITRIKKLPGKNIALVGGSGIAQTFTKLNLIDDYQIYLHQVIFGSDKSVLGTLDEERQLELVENRQFAGGGLRLHYRPIR